jgi:hypothetical protein
MGGLTKHRRTGDASEPHLAAKAVWLHLEQRQSHPPLPGNSQAMTATAERLSSALVDRYTIEREIGRGGMATVVVAFVSLASCWRPSRPQAHRRHRDS